MTNAELISFLKSNPLFSSLDEPVLKEIIHKFEKVQLHKNKILFKQGSTSDSFYILIQGALLITVMMDKKGRKFVHEIMPGETFGELGALSHEPRNSTVKALEDSLLLKIPSAAFLELSHRYPSISIALLNTSFSRSREFIKLLSIGEMPKKCIAILAANEYVFFHDFFQEFKKYIKPFQNIKLLVEQDADTFSTLQKEFEKYDKENKTIICFVTTPSSALAKLCFKSIDMMYIVGNAQTKPEIDPFVLDKINENKYRFKPELVLLHEHPTKPKDTLKWLKLTKFNLHHHIRIFCVNDYERLIRFMRGQAVGVVLGGGGLRSWAHLGALEALSKANIPIDAIGGTSAGALVAGFYAMHESYLDPDKELEQLSDVTRETISFKNLTWPTAAVFNGRAYTKTLKKIFKGRIENLWLPYFCISCDLSNNKQIVYRSGLLWKAIRSSTAVPAVFPPVVVHGKLYLDGGILNNLPVDVMKKIVGSEGTIAAVELTHNNVDLHQYHFPPVLPFWKTFLAKMGIAYKEYKFPGFVDTFLKALLAGSSAKQTENSVMADILVAPDLSRFSLLNVKKEQYAELIKLGFEAAQQAIKTWKKKIKKNHFIKN